MAYDKVFLRWGAEVKEFVRWKVIKVSLNVDDLMGKVRSKELRVNDSWTLYFDIIEKKPEKQKAWELTHYLVQNQKVADWEKTKAEQKAKPADDLPF